VKTEIKIEIIGNTHNIGDTNIITPDFCIVKAESCLYEDNMSRAWLKPAAFKFMFRLLDDDKETYFLGYCEKDHRGSQGKDHRNRRILQKTQLYRRACRLLGVGFF
jgi:hypothetical protein